MYLYTLDSCFGSLIYTERNNWEQICHDRSNEQFWVVVVV